jgi:hypothetical protein
MKSSVGSSPVVRSICTKYRERMETLLLPGKQVRAGAEVIIPAWSPRVELRHAVRDKPTPQESGHTIAIRLEQLSEASSFDT